MPLFFLAATSSAFAADLAPVSDTPATVLPVAETHGPRREPAHPRAEVRAPAPDGHLSVVAAMDVPAPLVSAGLELAITRRFSIAGHLGLGADDTLALYDMGGALRGYVLGDFDGGLFVGAGVGRTNFTPVSVGGTAYTADAFVGAKYRHAIGFTFEGAAGAELYVLQQTGAFSPTARLGVGWTF